MADPILTAGRHAVINAIVNASAFREGDRSVFQTVFRFDKEETFMEADALEETLAAADLPALAVWTPRLRMAWNRNTDQEWRGTVNITLWTKNHTLLLPEKWAENLIAAVHEQAAEGTTVSYVKTATGHHPVGEGEVSFQPVMIGKDQSIKAVRTTFNIDLRYWKVIN